jgi:hypothetical protein
MSDEPDHEAATRIAADEIAHTGSEPLDKSESVVLARAYRASQSECEGIRAERDRLTAALADDIRSAGWAVAVHNDYRMNGEPHTFWLLTKGDRAVKGEGRTDAEALGEVRALLANTDTPLGCEVEEDSSRGCERGTHGCEVRHPPTPSPAELHWCANPDGVDRVPSNERTQALCGGPLTYETDAGGNPNDVNCPACVRLLRRDGTTLSNPGDGTGRLCRALYGRKAEPKDYLGGSEATMLHDAATALEASRKQPKGGGPPL